MFSSYLLWTSALLDVPAGVTQEQVHIVFYHPPFPSAVIGLIFLARRIQLFLSLVDREVEYCVCCCVCVCVCVCVCFFFPFILDIKFVGRTSRGHTGGRSHRISHPPSFCGALIVLNLLGIFIIIYIFSEGKSHLPGFELTSQRGTRFRGYQLSYRGDRP